MNDEFPDVTTASREDSLERRAISGMWLMSRRAVMYGLDPLRDLEEYAEEIALIRDWCTAELQEIDRRKHGPDNGF